MTQLLAVINELAKFHVMLLRQMMKTVWQRQCRLHEALSDAGATWTRVTLGACVHGKVADQFLAATQHC